MQVPSVENPAAIIQEGQRWTCVRQRAIYGSGRHFDLSHPASRFWALSMSEELWR